MYPQKFEIFERLKVRRKAGCEDQSAFSVVFTVVGTVLCPLPLLKLASFGL